ncbi:MAG: signal peptidase II [Planctomycetes bacterium]|nr:signal peptidase II [Planctomycetota bacterium]
MKNTLTFVIPAVCGVIIDILSKWFIFSQVEAYEVITLIPGLLNIVRSENKGVVFGILPGKTNAFIVLSAIAIIAIVCIYLWSDRSNTKSNIALGLVLAGATGNLWDRIWFKGVRDFIDFHLGNAYHWPTFNIADSLICIGIFLMAITSFFTPKRG